MEKWKRQKRESAHAFAAFALYCNLGEERSYFKVGTDLHKSETLLLRWARKYNWQSRVRAYDEYIEQRKLEQTVKDRIAMVDRHVRYAMLIQRKSLEAILALDAKKLTPIEMARLFELATRIERSCRGEPDENQVAKINVIVEPFDPGESTNQS